MSGGGSEEKTLPASAKKLRDARKKGQVAKGPDLVAAVTTTALIAYAWLGAGWIGGRLQALVLAAGQAAGLGFADAMGQFLPAAARTLALVAGPALALAVLGAVLAGALVNKGFLFTVEPLKPKPDSINPVAGFKRLYGLKNWVELGKSLAKAALLGAALVLLWRGAVGVLVGVPACGAACVGPVFAATLRPLVGAALALYVASGLADLLLQRWLFLREMRMSVTEVKRESKDANGNPHVRGAQRRMRSEIGQGGGPKVGFRHATLVICGPEGAVGLHFVRGDTPLPVVACRAVGGERAASLVAMARAAVVPMFWDKALAVELARAIPVGQTISKPFFQRVTVALFASGAVQ